MKPKPWGILIFALCGTSGTLFDFIIFQEGTTELDETESLEYGWRSLWLPLFQKR